MAQTTEQFGSGTQPVKGDTIRTLLVKEVLSTGGGGAGVGGSTAVFQGTGNPNGVVSAPVGSIYNQISGGGALVHVFTKLSGGTGNTGWV